MEFNRGDSGSSLQSEINITPLVDVVLVLLIIFMVVVPLLMQGYDVNIPRTSTNAKPAQAQESRLILSISAHACGIIGPSAGEGLPADCRVTLADQMIPAAELPVRVAGDPGQPAHGKARAVSGRRRPLELRGSAAHPRSGKVGRRGFEGRIYHGN